METINKIKEKFCEELNIPELNDLIKATAFRAECELDEIKHQLSYLSQVSYYAERNLYLDKKEEIQRGINNLHNVINRMYELIDNIY